MPNKIDKRTRIGNTPTCGACGEQHGTDAECADLHPQTDQPTEKVMSAEVFGELEETSVPDPEDMNDRRSLAALMAVIAFSDDIGELPEDGTETEDRRNLLQQNIADMLADLMHLADRVPGLDFEAALETGQMHYAAETEDDADEPDYDDTVNECPNCEKPQQFKGLCGSCMEEMRNDPDNPIWEKLLQ